MDRTALVLGASGRFGGFGARALEQAGWTVRRFDRGRDRLPDAAQGAALIVNGWNPSYPRWRAELPALTDQVISAARDSGARLVQAGNVYVFGAGSPERLTETTPHRATNPLGRLRVEMEARLKDSGIRMILLRAGDFIDTRKSGNWYDSVILRPLEKGHIAYPGPFDLPHAWAFLPDLGRAIAGLADLDERLGQVEEVPFPGYTMTGAELAAGLSRVLERPIAARQMPWWPLKLARPFWPMARGLVEMGYLWSMPHHLDGSKFRRLLPDFSDTPLDAALAQSLGIATSTQTNR